MQSIQQGRISHIPSEGDCALISNGNAEMTRHVILISNHRDVHHRVDINTDVNSHNILVVNDQRLDITQRRGESDHPSMVVDIFTQEMLGHRHLTENGHGV